MATVILARHGRSTANVSGTLAGRSRGTHLDEVGRAQAAAAGERLKGLPLARLVTSPLERCRETAREIGRAQEKPVKASTHRGLVEVDYGLWTGRTLASLAKDPLWKVVQAQPSAARFPEGESLAAMSARAVAAVHDLDRAVEAEHGAGAVWVAVSHGDVIKAVLAAALGVHLDLFQRIVVDPASLSVVRFTTTRPFVMSINTIAGDLSHLKARPGSRRRRRGPDAEVGGGAGPAGTTT